jgi:hypothetical protein
MDLMNIQRIRKSLAFLQNIYSLLSSRLVRVIVSVSQA